MADMSVWNNFKNTHEECPVCKGTGSIEVWRSKTGDAYSRKPCTDPTCSKYATGLRRKPEFHFLEDGLIDKINQTAHQAQVVMPSRFKFKPKSNKKFVYLNAALGH